MPSPGRPSRWTPWWIFALALLLGHAGLLSAAKPEAATVGLYLAYVPELDLKTNTYVADFYLWFIWKGNIDPTQTFEFTNVIAPVELSKVPAYTDAAGNAKPEIMPDGRSYQVYHVQGRFWHPFPTINFPFDEQDVVLSIEDAKHTIDEVVYQIDRTGTTLSPALVIPGWKLGNVVPVTTVKRFPTNFGYSTGSATDQYSHVDFTVHVTRPRVGMFFKVVLPISLIMLITFGALFCKPEDIDARLCLTITALISAVALQYTTSTELPPVGYLLLIDKVFLLSFATILFTTFVSIFSNRLAGEGNHSGAHCLDRWGLIVLPIGFFGGALLFTFTS